MSSESYTSLFRRSHVRERYNRASVAARKKRRVVPDPDFATLSDDIIYQRCRRDPIVDHSMTYRRHLTTGRDWWMEPGGKTELDERMALVFDSALRQHLEKFSSARFNLAVAPFRSQAFGFPIGERRSFDPLGDGRNVDMWVPTRIKDVDKFRLRQRPITREDGIVRPAWEFFSFDRERWEVLQHPEWFIAHTYEDVEYQLGYGRGLLETIYYFLYFKTETMDDILNAIEKFSQGWVTAELEDDRLSSEMLDNPAYFDKWLEVIDKMRGQYSLVAPKGVKLSVVESNMTGMKASLDTISYYDEGMTRAILGSTMPTGGGEAGSFARAKVESNSTEAIVQFDQGLLDETITRDLIGLMWRLNQPQFAALGLEGAKMPHFKTRKESTVDQLTGTQILTGALNAGLVVPEQEAYRLAGIRPPTDMEIARGEVVKPEDMPTGGGGFFDAPGAFEATEVTPPEGGVDRSQPSAREILGQLQAFNAKKKAEMGDIEPEDVFDRELAGVA